MVMVLGRSRLDLPISGSFLSGIRKASFVVTSLWVIVLMSLDIGFAGNSGERRCSIHGVI
jgi:hypothetical protein